MSNALINERSPYLRQHANNPVDWLPWGEAAFEKARREDKPVFLSIGYSTCHWCHVMAHESFENPKIKALTALSLAASSGKSASTSFLNLSNRSFISFPFISLS